jgi:adenylate cyclase
MWLAIAGSLAATRRERWRGCGRYAADLIDPTISVHHGQIVKRTGDGSVIEFRSVVDAARCAVEVQHAMVERNAGVALEKRIEFRIGIHLGDVVDADSDEAARL